MVIGVFFVSVSTFDMSGLGASLGVTGSEAMDMRLHEHQETRKKAKSPADFLGENASLVNLDNLIDKPPMPAGKWECASHNVNHQPHRQATHACW